MSTRQSYSLGQITIHWLTALLVLFNYLYSEGMGHALDARLTGGAPAHEIEINPQLHVWVGVAVLVLVLIRFLLRYVQGVPEAEGTGLLGLAARWGHRALYALLILVPVLGGMAWFGGLDLAGEPHALLANAILILAGVHAAAAIFHQFVLNDGTLLRMVRVRA